MRVLVAGPPCAGKTTYVREHADDGDLVLDQDAIGPRAMQRGIAALGRETRDVWIIRCAPGPEQRARLAHALGADRVELLLPDPHELERRAMCRPEPHRVLMAIRKWHLAEAGLSGKVRGAHRGGRQARAVARETFAVYGTVCWICGHEGAGESDHVVPLSSDAAQALTVGGRRPAHGTSARCPTCGRACNQERGASMATDVFVPKTVW